MQRMFVCYLTIIHIYIWYIVFVNTFNKLLLFKFICNSMKKKMTTKIKSSAMILNRLLKSYNFVICMYKRLLEKSILKRILKRICLFYLVNMAQK